MRLKLETLTPIWTGNIQTRMSRVQEAGIIGSLRWWYEAIVRGLGHRACDPSSHTCPGCRVCELFGATGSRRKFLLRVHESDMKENGPDDHIKIPGTKGWFLKGGMMGDLELEIVGIKAGFDARAIAGLIALIARRAGIGAKTQMGYGIVQFKEQAPPAQPFENHLKGLGTGTYAPSDLPDLREMFFAEMKTSKVVSRQKDNVKPTLLLKRDLRAAFRGCLRDNYKDRTLRHELMGEVRGNSRIGSKISISQPFDSGSGPVMRMWGWVPEYLAVRAGVSRCDVLDRIKGVVPSSALLTWEEMDPSKVPSFLGI